MRISEPTLLTRTLVAALSVLTTTVWSLNATDDTENISRRSKLSICKLHRPPFFAAARLRAPFCLRPTIRSSGVRFIKSLIKWFADMAGFLMRGDSGFGLRWSLAYTGNQRTREHPFKKRFHEN